MATKRRNAFSIIKNIKTKCPKSVANERDRSKKLQTHKRVGLEVQRIVGREVWQYLLVQTAIFKIKKS